MNRYQHLALLPLIAVSVSCGSGNHDVLHSGGHELVRVGNCILTESDLVSSIPYGLAPEDSVKYARAFIRQWIEAQLVGEIASRNISDMSRIDKMVNEYRNELIMREYCRLMYAEHSNEDINADSLMSYYERHRSDYKTTVPLIKGIFIKVPENDRSLAGVRKWSVSKNSDDLDKLEQVSMDNNVEYEYFRDDWKQWQSIVRKFPTDMSGKLSSIPKSGERRFEVVSDGFVYILAVSEYMPVGNVMPYDMVEGWLIEQFRSSNRPEYERNLRQQLYEKGVSDGIVKLNVDLGITEVAQQDKNNK